MTHPTRSDGAPELNNENDRLLALAASARLAEHAKSQGIDAKPVPPEWGSPGVIVRTIGNKHVIVMRMLFTWRVMETDLDGWPAGRFWYYPADGLTAALQNAYDYSDGDAEPGGWVRAWDGRRG